MNTRNWSDTKQPTSLNSCADKLTGTKCVLYVSFYDHTNVSTCLRNRLFRKSNVSSYCSYTWIASLCL